MHHTKFMSISRKKINLTLVIDKDLIDYTIFTVLPTTRTLSFIIFDK